MKPWLPKLSFWLFATTGLVLVHGWTRTDAAQLSLSQLEHYQVLVHSAVADAGRRPDFRSARRVVWILLDFSDLVGEAGRAATPAPSRSELEAAWSLLLMRAETRQQLRQVDELRDRYATALQASAQ